MYNLYYIVLAERVLGGFMSKLAISLKFNNEELMKEVEIMSEAIGRLDDCDPSVKISNGFLVIKGDDHIWNIDLKDYIRMSV